MERKNPAKTVLITGLALFAMFFGAGNLIFPVQIGAQSGVAQVPATIGFLATGVLLPMLAMVAAATSSSGVLGISERISHYPGLVFCWAIFLSTGVLYAIPRTATVSFEMSLGANKGFEGSQWLLIYVAIFFVLSAVFALNPKNMLQKIGGFLTPALLLLLLVLIAVAFFKMTPSQATPLAESGYDSTPAITGLLQGYGTLDAIASFVFGVIIIKSLRREGYQPGRSLFSMTALSGVVAAICLALVYAGLSMVGRRVAVIKPKIENGADGLVTASAHLFGPIGAALLALIAILACLTTSIGLIGASTQFFQGLFPQINRTKWIIIHAVISFIVANAGLDLLLKIVIPIMYLCYPITICLVITCLLDIFLPGHMFWAYRGSVWVSAVFGLVDAIKAGIGLLYPDANTIPATAQATVDFIDRYIPLAKYSLGWVIPALVFFLIGLLADYFQGRMKHTLDYDRIARERNQQLIDAGLGDVLSEEELAAQELADKKVATS